MVRFQGRKFSRRVTDQRMKSHQIRSFNVEYDKEVKENRRNFVREAFRYFIQFRQDTTEVQQRRRQSIREYLIKMKNKMHVCSISQRGGERHPGGWRAGEETASMRTAGLGFLTLCTCQRIHGDAANPCFFI